MHEQKFTYDLQDALDQQLQEDGAGCLTKEGSSSHTSVTTVKSSAQLQRHAKTVGGNAKSFHCDFCDKSFEHKRYLAEHIARAHQSNKKFSCDFCKKSFRSKNYLDLHITTVHLGNKNFSCEICNKSFGRKSTLQTHIKTVHEDKKKIV